MLDIGPFFLPDGSPGRVCTSNNLSTNFVANIGMPTMMCDSEIKTKYVNAGQVQ